VIEQANEITLGGRKLTVHYGMNAVREIEKALGKTIFDVLKEIRNEGIGVNEIVIIIWAGLIKNYRRVTQEAVCDWLDEEMDHIEEIAELCGNALAQAMTRYIKPAGKDLGEGEVPEEKN
jgi:hypothetical protein